MLIFQNFDFTTPMLVFPAISLLMLAYTNRFVVLADLIRDLYDRQQTNPHPQNLNQIKNLKYRMSLIKKMQVLGAVSFILAAISVLVGLLSFILFSAITFSVSVLSLIISLTYLLKELFVSIDALTIQLEDLEK